MAAWSPLIAKVKLRRLLTDRLNAQIVSTRTSSVTCMRHGQALDPMPPWSVADVLAR